jgi:photosystem II stability/assembly factor-like uncharacterized protein
MLLNFSAAALRVAVSLLLVMSTWVMADPYAPIMPLASRSLLLDLTLAGDRLVAVGHDGLILATDDGGENWRIQRDGLASQHQANLEMREEAYQRIRELEQRLETADDEARPDLELALEDAQFDMEDAELALEEPVFTSPLMDVWFQDRERGWAIGAFGTILATENGGLHWTDQRDSIDNPDEFHLNSVTGDGKERLFIAGEGGVMFRSLDAGQSWETIEPFYEGSWFGVIYQPHQDLLVAFGLQGNLFRSTDFGLTWNPVLTDSNITLAGGNAAPNGEIVIVGGVGTVLHSIDGGQTFTRIMIEDRLSLSSGISIDSDLILIGQGGAKIHEAAK